MIKTGTSLTANVTVYRCDLPHAGRCTVKLYPGLTFTPAAVPSAPVLLAYAETCYFADFCNFEICNDNIYGDGVSTAISFSCLHGAGPPTNATATPVLRNITVQNMALTGAVGDGYGVTGARTCATVLHGTYFI